MGKKSKSQSPTKHVKFPTMKSPDNDQKLADMATAFATFGIKAGATNIDDTAVKQPASMIFNSMFNPDKGMEDETWSYNDQACAQVTKVRCLTVPDKKKNISMMGYLFKMKILEINSQTSNAKAVLMKSTDGVVGIAVFVFNSFQRWNTDMETFMAICEERWGPCEARNNAFVHLWNNIVTSGHITGSQAYFYVLPDQTVTYTSVVKDSSGENNELVSSVYISPGGKFLFELYVRLIVVYLVVLFSSLYDVA